MDASIRIKEVFPLDSLTLSVLFTNGVTKLYDVAQLIPQFPQMFSPLKDDPALFRSVTVDCGGCGVSWNQDIDISEWELWDNGRVKDDTNSEITFPRKKGSPCQP